MKKLFQRSVALIAAITIVFFSAFTSLRPLIDDVDRNTAGIFWQEDQDNSRRI